MSAIPDDLQRFAVAAVSEAYQITARALERLERVKNGDPDALAQYNRYFGSTQSLQTVSSNFQRALNRFEEGLTLRYASARECGAYAGSCRAFVRPGDNTINIVLRFFGQPDRGPGSRGGTVLHEVLHTVGVVGTEFYGAVEAQTLVDVDVQRALNNADNYRVFAEIE